MPAWLKCLVSRHAFFGGDVLERGNVPEPAPVTMAVLPETSKGMGADDGAAAILLVFGENQW